MFSCLFCNTFVSVYLEKTNRHNVIPLIRTTLERKFGITRNRISWQTITLRRFDGWLATIVLEQYVSFSIGCAFRFK
ncbi:hypothetical protein [Vibrio gallaecicus]|uniref:hypothetical protein n=1 Tax=Vibrio gallaecicus TaxID=552386 RepID=UPI0025B5DB59|nr:hypothetical protein [Vibrio gallaecicus]MDN3617088.1 hypothetical protein [Vibrio gallaecicus]